MSNPRETDELLLPAEAYRQATSSLVYRLSELMFGSLLAAYCLGFVGAIAAALASLPSVYRPLGIGLLATQYLCISITFTYLTTSFYLTYHVGILTQPRVPFKSLRDDFTIAVLQAVFFGLSLLLPALFPVLLAANIFRSARRQNEEYMRLVDNLFEYCQGREKSKPTFRDALAKHLRTTRHLKFWAPIERDTMKKGKQSLISGVLVVGLYWVSDSITPHNVLSRLLDWLNTKLPQFLMEWIARPLLTPWGIKQLAITIVVLVATRFVYKHALEVLGERASFRGFPIKRLDSCRYPVGATLEKFCKYKGDAEDGDIAKTPEPSAQLTSTGKSETGVGDVQGDPRTKKFLSIDEEYQQLPGEVRRLCEDLFPQS